MPRKSDTQRKYESMTLPELEEENQKCSDQREAIRQEQLVMAGVMTAKASAEDARRTLARMSDPQKEALRQIVQAEGVGSDESVGDPTTG